MRRRDARWDFQLFDNASEQSWAENQPRSVQRKLRKTKTLQIVRFPRSTGAPNSCSPVMDSEGRRGLGKIRHLATADLWVQDRVRRGDFKLTKVLGTENPADMLTKHISRDVMLRHMERVGIYAESGRAKSAPTIEHK